MGLRSPARWRAWPWEVGWQRVSRAQVGGMETGWGKLADFHVTTSCMLTGRAVSAVQVSQQEEKGGSRGGHFWVEVLGGRRGTTRTMARRMCG